jgi:hypothetical protein
VDDTEAELWFLTTPNLLFWPARIAYWPTIISEVELEIPSRSFINNVSHPEDILCGIDSRKLHERLPLFCWSNITRHLLIILTFLSIIRNNGARDRTKTPSRIQSCWTPPLSIFYVLVIRNTLCGVNHTKKCTSLPPSTKYFPLITPIHNPQFYVCGILISGDHVHVQWIKLAGVVNPFILLGKKSDTSPLVLSFSALVSDTLAIRHWVWQDLNELLLAAK